MSVNLQYYLKMGFCGVPGAAYKGITTVGNVTTIRTSQPHNFTTGDSIGVTGKLGLTGFKYGAEMEVSYFVNVVDEYTFTIYNTKSGAISGGNTSFHTSGSAPYAAVDTNDISQIYFFKGIQIASIDLRENWDSTSPASNDVASQRYGISDVTSISENDEVYIGGGIRGANSNLEDYGFFNTCVNTFHIGKIDSTTKQFYFFYDKSSKSMDSVSNNIITSNGEHDLYTGDYVQITSVTTSGSLYNKLINNGGTAADSYNGPIYQVKRKNATEFQLLNQDGNELTGVEEGQGENTITTFKFRKVVSNKSQTATIIKSFYIIKRSEFDGVTGRGFCFWLAPFTNTNGIPITYNSGNLTQPWVIRESLARDYSKDITGVDTGTGKITLAAGLADTSEGNPILVNSSSANSSLNIINISSVNDSDNTLTISTDSYIGEYIEFESGSSMGSTGLSTVTKYYLGNKVFDSLSKETFVGANTNGISSSIITSATNHNLVTGDNIVISSTNDFSVSAIDSNLENSGLMRGRTYFINKQSDTQFKVYLTSSDAINNTNSVSLTNTANISTIVFSKPPTTTFSLHSNRSAAIAGTGALSISGFGSAMASNAMRMRLYVPKKYYLGTLNGSKTEFQLMESYNDATSNKNPFHISNTNDVADGTTIQRFYLPTEDLGTFTIIYADNTAVNHRVRFVANSTSGLLIDTTLTHPDTQNKETGTTRKGSTVFLQVGNNLDKSGVDLDTIYYVDKGVETGDSTTTTETVPNAYKQKGNICRKITYDGNKYYTFSIDKEGGSAFKIFYYQTGQTVTVGGTIPTELSNVSSGDEFTVEIYGDEENTLGANSKNLPTSIRLHKKIADLSKTVQGASTGAYTHSTKVIETTGVNGRSGVEGVRPILVSGTNPTSLIMGKLYFMKVGTGTNTNFTLYTNKNDADAGTNKLELGTADIDDLSNIKFITLDNSSAINLESFAVWSGSTQDISQMTFSMTHSAFSDAGNVEGIPMSFACLLAGTQILTPNGEVAIELLKKGDEIVTHDKRVLKIKEVNVSQVGRNKPYKVPKDFFGKNLPSQDTYLSGDHAIRKVEEENAWMLPKYLPLEYCLKIENLEKYYNLQLESMEDTFVANGLAVESWDGNQEPTEYYWKKSTERHNFMTHHRHYLTEEEIEDVKNGNGEIYKKYLM